MCLSILLVAVTSQCDDYTTGIIILAALKKLPIRPSQDENIMVTDSPGIPPTSLMAGAVCMYYILFCRGEPYETIVALFPSSSRAGCVRLQDRTLPGAVHHGHPGLCLS